jgi:hypothetical protein
MKNTRDYLKHSLRDPTSHRTPEQIRAMDRGYNHQPKNVKKRDMRNAARAAVAKRMGHPVPSGMDVDHKMPVRRGGSNAPSNLRVISASRNRGWADGKV